LAQQVPPNINPTTPIAPTALPTSSHPSTANNPQTSFSASSFYPYPDTATKKASNSP
jgi:hypothetical protein